MDVQAHSQTELSASLTGHASRQLSVCYKTPPCLVPEENLHLLIATLFQVQQAIKLLALTCHKHF